MAETTIQTGNVGAQGLTEAPARDQPGGASVARQYGVISVFLVPALVGVFVVGAGPAAPVTDPRVLLGPVFALLGLTALVWFLMLVARNASVVTQRAPIAFFRNFDGHTIPDWVERPARTFNNLMQLPTVFYAIGALMLQVGAVDSVQVSLAWIFAGSRYLHAVVFVVWNDVKWRFATAMVGFVSLGMLLYRFAAATAPLWLG